MKKDLHQISKDSITVYFTNDIANLQEEWNVLAANNVYFNSNYLRLLQDYGPLGYSYYFAFAKIDDKPMGIFYFQRKLVDLSKDFRIHTHSKNPLSKLRVRLLKQFFKLIKNQLLIFGNVLLTGEYAYKLAKNLPDESRDILNQIVLDGIEPFIHQCDNIRVKTSLVKDFYSQSQFKKLEFRHPDYTRFKVQPDMILSLDPAWIDYDDYLQAVRSKYRVKFNKVKSKSRNLDFRILDINGAARHNEAMYALYEATADRALFSLFKLHPEYFKELKRVMGEDMVICGVFEGDKLIAFYTFIKNGEIGDAHFLGYDVRQNSKYQLYFNILLKLIEIAIMSKVKFLNLSRTALEIKSSVGAEPYEMDIYLRHHNGFLNKQLPWILDRIVPDNDWQPRSPFK